VVGSACW